MGSKVDRGNRKHVFVRRSLTRAKRFGDGGVGGGKLSFDFAPRFRSHWSVLSPIGIVILSLLGSFSC